MLCLNGKTRHRQGTQSPRYAKGRPKFKSRREQDKMMYYTTTHPNIYMPIMLIMPLFAYA